MASRFSGSSSFGHGDDDELQERVAWWMSHGPKTRLGQMAHADDPETCDRAWAVVRAKLMAAGLPGFRLDNSFNDTDYTVDVEGARVPVEEVYPEDAQVIDEILTRYPDVRQRQGVSMTTQLEHWARNVVEAYLQHFPHQSLIHEPAALRTAFESLEVEGRDVAEVLEDIDRLQSALENDSKHALRSLIGEACEQLAVSGQSLAEAAQALGRTKRPGALSPTAAQVEAHKPNGGAATPGTAPTIDELLDESDLFEDAPEDVRGDRELIRQLVGVAPQVLSHATNEVRLDAPFIAECVSRDIRCFVYLPESMQTNSQVVSAACALLPEPERPSPFSVDTGLRAVASHLLANDKSVYQHLPRLIRADADLTWSVMEKTSDCLPHVDPSLWNEGDFMLRALKKWETVVPYIPESNRTDAAFMTSAIERQSKAISLVHPDLWGKADFVRPLLGDHPRVLADVPESLLDDEALMTMGVGAQLQCFAYASERLQLDPEFLRVAYDELEPSERPETFEPGAVLKAVASVLIHRSVHLYALLPGPVRSDPDLSWHAVDNRPELIPSVDESLWQDRDFALRALKRSEGALPFIPPDFFDDPDFMAEVVAVRSDMIALATQRVRDTPDFVTAVVAQYPERLNEFAPRFRDDVEFIRQLLEEHDLWASALLSLENRAVREAYESTFAELGSIAQMPSRLQQPLADIQADILKHPERLVNAPRIVKSDEALMTAYCRKNGWAIAPDVAGDMRGSLVVTLASVANGGAVEDPRLTNNTTFMKLAVAISPVSVLANAPAAIRDDPDIVRTAVLIDPDALAHASARLRGDPHHPDAATGTAFVDNLVRTVPTCLQHASEAIRDREDLALEAISQAWRQYEHLSPRLRGDPRIIVAAAEQAQSSLGPFLPHPTRDNVDVMSTLVEHFGCLAYATPRLRGHRGFALAELRLRPKSMAWVSPDLVLDPQFQREVRDIGSAQLTQKLEEAIDHAQLLRVRTRDLPSKEEVPAWGWWSAEGSYHPDEILADSLRLARAGSRAFGGRYLSQNDAVAFAEITKGRILPNDIEHLYDDAVALYNELNPAGPLLAVEMAKVSIETSNNHGTKLVFKADISADGEYVGKLKATAYEDGTAYIDHFELTGEAQRLGIKPLLYSALFNLYYELKTSEVSLTAGLTLGKYVWARDFFDAKPEKFSEVQDRLVDFINARGKAFAAAGISQASLDLAIQRVKACEHMWELASLRFPQTESDAGNHGGTIDVKERQTWGLKPNHHLGRYHLGKLFLLSQQPKWSPALKDTRENGHSLQMQLSFRSYLASIVARTNRARSANGDEPLSPLEIESVARRLREV